MFQYSQQKCWEERNECKLPSEHFGSWPVDVRRLPAQVGYTDAIDEANEYAEQQAQQFTQHTNILQLPVSCDEAERTRHHWPLLTTTLVNVSLGQTCTSIYCGKMSYSYWGSHYRILPKKNDTNNCRTFAVKLCSELLKSNNFYTDLEHFF